MISNEETPKQKFNRRNVACFFFFGLLSLIFDEIATTAAEDVLSGSKMATSSIILSIALPLLTIKLTAPWIMHGVSYPMKVALIFSLFLVGLSTWVFSPQYSGRLVGVSLTETGVALSEITFLSLTAFYEDISLSAFVAGIGMSSLLGPLYYTGMTTWLCVPPKFTMMFSIPWPVAFFLLYALLNKEPLRRTQSSVTDQEANAQNSKSPEHYFSAAKEGGGNSYLETEALTNSQSAQDADAVEVLKTGTDLSARDSQNSINLDPNHKESQERCSDAELEGRESGVDSDPKDHDKAAGFAPRERGKQLDKSPDESGVIDNSSDGSTALTWGEKLSGAKKIFPYISFLFVTYLAEYLSNHAIITTIAFRSSAFSPRDHYAYYLLSYHIGKFLGRSHFFMIHTFVPSLFPYITIKRTWTLALVQVFHLIFFSLVAWYRFVTQAWIIIVLCFTEGFTAGSMYVNSAYTVSDKIAAPGLRQFALCILTVGNAFGKLTAGFLGLYQEPYFRKHCLHDLGLGEYCFTRHGRRSAWDKASGCKSRA